MLFYISLVSQVCHHMDSFPRDYLSITSSNLNNPTYTYSPTPPFSSLRIHTNPTLCTWCFTVSLTVFNIIYSSQSLHHCLLSPCHTPTMTETLSIRIYAQPQQIEPIDVQMNLPVFRINDGFNINQYGTVNLFIGNLIWLRQLPCISKEFFFFFFSSSSSVNFIFLSPTSFKCRRQYKILAFGKAQKHYYSYFSHVLSTPCINHTVR